MKEYIDKSALVAEIEKELNTTKKYSTEYVNGKKYALKKILSFIDTLEVKEVEEEPVSEDLGEAANTYVDNWYKLNNLDKESYPIDVEISKNDFKAGAKWQKEQMEKNRIAHCDSITEEQYNLETGFLDSFLDKNKRMPTFLDAIEYGMKKAMENKT